MTCILKNIVMLLDIVLISQEQKMFSRLEVIKRN